MSRTVMGDVFTGSFLWAPQPGIQEKLDRLSEEDKERVEGTVGLFFNALGLAVMVGDGGGLEELQEAATEVLNRYTLCL